MNVRPRLKGAVHSRYQRDPVFKRCEWLHRGSQFIERFDGKQGTRLAWMNHGIGHEDYHRGQLTTYARLLGLVPALTQLIHGSK